MTPPIFIGDRVRVVGPTSDGRQGTHEDFEVTQIGRNPEGTVQYSALQVPWYPASSLRLVEEELKIGDFVEIVGAPFGLSTKHGVGKCAQVRGKTDQGNYRLSDICYIYSRSALRKLTPEEIRNQTPPLAYRKGDDWIEARLNSLEDHTRENDARLSAIEKQLEEQQKTISQFDGEIAHLIGSIQECLIESGDVEARTKCREMKIEGRLAFVEQIQRDQSDLIGRAIRDGVAEILDFRRKA